MDLELAERYHFADFTEDGYRGMLKAAARGYSFEPFGTGSAEPHVLWRHDVDFSPHRALRLAEMEAEQGVRATYFLFLHSHLYNLMEADVFARTRRILELGHWLGLHFDAGFYEIATRGRAGREAHPGTGTAGEPVRAAGDGVLFSQSGYGRPFR